MPYSGIIPPPTTGRRPVPTATARPAPPGRGGRPRRRIAVAAAMLVAHQAWCGRSGPFLVGGGGSTVNDKSYESGSFCDNEGSLHQMALDMIHHSSPPGSKSYDKLKHVLGLAPFFHVNMGRDIFSQNEAMLRRMLRGAGLWEGPKPSGKGLANMTLVETWFTTTSSSCPLEDEACRDQPRILLQTEQAIEWPPFVACHESPRCVVLEFSDYNYEMARGWREELTGSTVLLPVMTQTPSRLAEHEPEVPEVVSRRGVDLVFFGERTNRRNLMWDAVDGYRERHPNRTVFVQKNKRPRIAGGMYADGKVCLISHSKRSNSGGEYHRLSEFGPFGCIPVMEEFGDEIGMEAYKRCGGAVFAANRTSLIPVAEEVVAKIDQGSYDGKSKAIIEWWRAGIRWEEILPTVYGVDCLSSICL